MAANRLSAQAEPQRVPARRQVERAQPVPRHVAGVGFAVDGDVPPREHLRLVPFRAAVFLVLFLHRLGVEDDLLAAIHPPRQARARVGAEPEVVRAAVRHLDVVFGPGVRLIGLGETGDLAAARQFLLRHGVVPGVAVGLAAVGGLAFNPEQDGLRAVNRGADGRNGCHGNCQGGGERTGWCRHAAFLSFHAAADGRAAMPPRPCNHPAARQVSGKRGGLRRWSATAALHSTRQRVTLVFRRATGASSAAARRGPSSACL